MKRDFRLYIDDILEALKKIEQYVEGLSFDDFSKDCKTVDAVVRNFEVIGEAAKRISIEVKRENPQVPWKMMTGMRDKLIHEYFGVNLKVLWTTVKEDLPTLRPSIEKLLRKMDDEMEQ